MNNKYRLTNLEAYNLPKGVEVIFIGHPELDSYGTKAFIKGAIYKTGGSTYDKKRREPFVDVHHRNYLQVIEDSEGRPNGWQARAFILATKVGRILYGK